MAILLYNFFNQMKLNMDLHLIRIISFKFILIFVLMMNIEIISSNVNLNENSNFDLIYKRIVENNSNEKNQLYKIAAISRKSKIDIDNNIYSENNANNEKEGDIARNISNIHEEINEKIDLEILSNDLKYFIHIVPYKFTYPININSKYKYILKKNCNINSKLNHLCILFEITDIPNNSKQISIDLEYSFLNPIYKVNDNTSQMEILIENPYVYNIDFSYHMSLKSNILSKEDIIIDDRYKDTLKVKEKIKENNSQTQNSDGSQKQTQQNTENETQDISKRISISNLLNNKKNKNAKKKIEMKIKKLNLVNEYKEIKVTIKNDEFGNFLLYEDNYKVINDYIFSYLYIFFYILIAITIIYTLNYFYFNDFDTNVKLLLSKEMKTIKRKKKAEIEQSFIEAQIE